MKKTIKTLALLALCILCLTACGMKMQYGIIVNPDNTIKMEVISATRNKQIDHEITLEELRAEAPEGVVNPDNVEDKTYTDEERWNYVENNKENVPSGDYTEERFDDGEYKGFKYERILGNIEDAVAEEVSLNMEEIDSAEKLFTKNGDLYELNIPVMSEEQVQEMLSGSSEDEELDFVCEFYLTLPEPAVSHNATNVSEDGLTYTWDLLKSPTVSATFKANKVEKVAEKNEETEEMDIAPIETENNEANETAKTEDNNSNKYLIIGIVVAIILILGIAICMSKKKK